MSPLKKKLSLVIRYIKSKKIEIKMQTFLHRMCFFLRISICYANEQYPLDTHSESSQKETKTKVISFIWLETMNNLWLKAKFDSLCYFLPFVLFCHLPTFISRLTCVSIVRQHKHIDETILLWKINDRLDFFFFLRFISLLHFFFTTFST